MDSIQPLSNNLLFVSKLSGIFEKKKLNHKVPVDDRQPKTLHDEQRVAPSIQPAALAGPGLSKPQPFAESDAASNAVSNDVSDAVPNDQTIIESDTESDTVSDLEIADESAVDFKDRDNVEQKHVVEAEELVPEQVVQSDIVEEEDNNKTRLCYAE